MLMYTWAYFNVCVRGVYIYISEVFMFVHVSIPSRYMSRYLNNPDRASSQSPTQRCFFG